MEFADLKKAIDIIKKERRCNWGLDFGCGCSMVHDILYQCSKHHEQLIEMADFLHMDTPERNAFVEEIWGVKIVSGVSHG